MRFEYTPIEESILRVTEIQAILESNLYEDEKEEKELIAEKKELKLQIELSNIDLEDVFIRRL